MFRPRKSSTPSFAECVSAAQARAEDNQPCRALVALPTEEKTTPFDHLKGLGASFLTHLIAMTNRSPQTRVLRRGSPDEAVASYEIAQHREEVSAQAFPCEHISHLV